ncbi:MAG TPA: sugar ABC transporter permease [Solirubrobacter sp.]|nr:sugar ABC transporter permease [Solirubrobacter sp.]
MDALGEPGPRRRLALRVAGGEFGSLRVLVMLALIWAIFQIANDRFLSAINLSNLMLQITAVGTISIGVTLVLLLGEIDLSVASLSGLAGGVVAVLAVKQGWPQVLAIVVGLLVGAAVGLINGTFVTRLKLPSFVVTLAGLIAWQGALLAVLGDTGTINLPPGLITGLTTTFLAPWAGWLAGALAVALVLGGMLLRRVQRVRQGLEPGALAVLVVRLAALVVATAAAVWVLNQDRGVPVATLILVGLVAAFAFLTSSTVFGRHVYSVGGNAEAARRSGIHVTRVRTVVFVLGSTLAAAGGILAESRLLSVNQSSGSGDLLLLAIAGPVIAGVSLFGGRGSVWAALLGALVIGSIANGMDLLALDSSVKFMITGAVLLAAVSLDAATRLRSGSGEP